MSKSSQIGCAGEVRSDDAGEAASGTAISLMEWQREVDLFAENRSATGVLGGAGFGFFVGMLCRERG
ncbi:MAG: hypothetical protein H7144_17770 [Burkholderiales bacterium]|nr:hypothetical protein [Phycisphaerae bacterium]